MNAEWYLKTFSGHGDYLLSGKYIKKSDRSSYGTHVIGSNGAGPFLGTVELLNIQYETNPRITSIVYTVPAHGSLIFFSQAI